MLLVSEYVTVSIRGSDLKRYEDLGYVIPTKINKYKKRVYNYRASLLVKLQDLPNGSSAKIDVICDYCGKTKSIAYKDYLRNKKNEVTNKDSCSDCSIEKTRESNLKLYGVENALLLPNIREKASASNRTSIEKVKSDFKNMGFKPIFTDYKNSKQQLEYICEKHPDIIQTKTYDSILAGEGCFYCGRESIRGRNNCNWKGGITDLSNYIRNTPSIKMWKRDSMEYRGEKCVKTRKGTKLEIHHATKSFSDILYQALDDVGLDIRASTSQYTHEELHKIEMKCLSLHYWYGFGYPIVKEEHVKFHKKYGYSGFTEEDFNEFVYGYHYRDYYTGALLGE